MFLLVSKRKNEATSYLYSEGSYKGLTAWFYTNDKIKRCNLKDALSTKDINLQNNDLIILMNHYHERDVVEYLGFEVEHRSIPLWIEKMNLFYKVYPADKTLLLYSKPQ